MKQAVVRFKKDVILKQGIEEQPFRTIYENQVQNFHHYYARRWSDAREDEQARFISGFNQQYNNEINAFNKIIPNVTSEVTWYFSNIEFGVKDINELDFTKNEMTVSFITDEFTIVDSVGDKILIGKGNLIEGIRTDDRLKDLYFVNLPEELSISRYTTFNI